MADSLLITGGRVVDPSQGLDEPRDVLIVDGQIEAVDRGVSRERAARTIDASGLIVSPGFVDIHTHLREPGGEVSETIESGARSAAAGGFTTVFCMPNTRPVCDSSLIVRSIIERACAAGHARVVPVASVTTGMSGEHLNDYTALLEAGAGAFSDDGLPVANAQMMRRAMQSIADLGAPIFDHCEDLDLTGPGVMHEGVVSARLGVPGIPRNSEALCVMRDCALALETGAHLHICHVSNVESIEAIRWFKSRGARVTAEVSPHHLTLTDEAVDAFNVNAKMKPPLCDETDRVALIEALEQGIIDIIATDHAPHAPATKDTTLDQAPFGILGFETAFPVLHREFVETGRWTLPFLIERMTIGPAQIVGGAWGTLKPGSPGDVVLLASDRSWRYESSMIRSRSRNTPWLDEMFPGGVEATIFGGRVTHVHEGSPMGATLAGG
ncbi:MAG: dihydroorotase [Phycisphaerales bacterium]